MDKLAEIIPQYLVNPIVFTGFLDIAMKGMTTPDEYLQFIEESVYYYQNAHPEHQLMCDIHGQWSEGGYYDVHVSVIYIDDENILQLQRIRNTNKPSKQS